MLAGSMTVGSTWTCHWRNMKHRPFNPTFENGTCGLSSYPLGSARGASQCTWRDQPVYLEGPAAAQDRNGLGPVGPSG